MPHIEITKEEYINCSKKNVVSKFTNIIKDKDDTLSKVRIELDDPVRTSYIWSDGIITKHWNEDKFYRSIRTFNSTEEFLEDISKLVK